MSLNDLSIQNHLFDRRWVYKLCDDNGIPTPRHAFCNRGEDERGELIEGMVPTDDFPTPWSSSELEVRNPVDSEPCSKCYTPRCSVACASPPKAGRQRARKGARGARGAERDVT